MAKRGDPRVLRLVVLWLRSIPKWTQGKLAEASGVRQSDVSRYEQGLEAPAEEVLRRMARAVRVPWSVAVQVRKAFRAALLIAEREAQGTSSAGADESGRIWGEVMTLALTPYFIEEEARRATSPAPEELRQEAARIWTALVPFPEQRRLALLKAYPWDVWKWEALIERICIESSKTAANDVRQALELAEFARAVAALGSFEAGVRSLIEAYIWGFMGNARRVANELESADQAFSQVEVLLAAGAGSTTGLLDLSRLLDLEASLRKDQQRYPEALALLGKARAASAGDSAIGRILLKKEHVLERMGDHEGALAVLAEARPFIERSAEPRLLFALHFNTADNLCHLERHGEAALLLPLVRELALREENRLDLIRARWLEARVAAGCGRDEEAMVTLAEVLQIFTAENLPYDAALTALDLAVLLLGKGRTAEVRELALEMGWIFDANGIHREAVAALTLFFEAAKQDCATVELVRQVMREVERRR